MCVRETIFLQQFAMSLIMFCETLAPQLTLTSHQASLLSWNNGTVDRLELYFYLNNYTHFMSLKP